MNNSRFRYFILFLIFSLIFSSCEKEEPEVGNNLTKQDVYDIMNEYYLWLEKMPDIDPAQYNTPEDVLDALKYKDLDEWSYISTTKEYIQYYDEGEYVGHGFGVKADEEGNIRISFVFGGSPADNHKVKRGWRIHKINDQIVTLYNYSSDLLGSDEIGVTNDFVFLDLTGAQVSMTIEKALVTIHPVLHFSIRDVKNTRAGYLVFNHFIRSAYQELEEVFCYFQEEGVDELILDLRYNRGGREDVAVYLAGLIAGIEANNQVLNKRVHNSKHPELDTVTRIQTQDFSVDLDRIFIISTRITASASELLINGFKPHMEVIQIGDDTYGKPVGAYSFQFEDYTLIPICFRFLNANDEGDFFDGISPDAYVSDDLNEPFGNLEEDCYHEALYYIENGSFSSQAGKKSVISKEELILETGIKFEIGAY